MPGAAHALTLVVHGTYAAETNWWQLGSTDSPTFADRLESALANRGLAGSVWTPALTAGFDYSSFSWTGTNRHRDRVKAGRRLSTTLNDLARRLGATGDAPLTVNFVAHSHGGNVVLEALRRLDAAVRVGRIVLRATQTSIAYGPSPARLRTLLRARPIVLLTTENDEADVLLQLGSAPGRLYREYVEAEFSFIGVWLEKVLLRPIVFGVLLRSLEVFLSIVALGFSAWRSLWFDHDVVPDTGYYPRELLARERLSVLPSAAPSLAVMIADGTPRQTGSGLRGSIYQVMAEIKRQVRLRHSAYYENEAVLQRVADVIAGAPAPVGSGSARPVVL